ncbi:MAG: efflux RND transporter permease subunit [Planctomycetes bacterium]|nr:efflux RND transporter permease subunit [Planctomycetota bacterium]MCC7171905.1 efflux RND transporter permease subunit [Planctomycetota bacterium]
MNAIADIERKGLLTGLIRRPVTALMILISIFVLGVIAYSRMPLMLMPDGVTYASLEVSVSVANGSPLETVDKVTRPIEDELRTMPNVREISSTSSTDEADISVRFNGDTDMDTAYADVKDRLERVRSSLPDGVSQIRIRRWNPSIMPIYFLGILYDQTVDDPFGKVEDIIQQRIESVDGVAQLQIRGMVRDTVRIFVQPERLKAHGLDFYEVVAKLRRDNFSLPAGRIDDGGREFLLRIDSQFQTPADIENYPIAENVRLKDVADVTLARAYRDYVSRVNGKASLFASVNKESDANTVDTCRRLGAQLEQMKKDPRLAGFSFSVYWDQSDMIVGAIDNLKSSAAYGAFFAVAILYLFVRRVSTTAFVALAIPVSLMAAVVCVYFCGKTFNIISLAGFTLAIGMLVDNSIVVAENIERRRRLGDSPQRAAETGASQVGLAILLSTLTTVIVFAPMVFMTPNEEGRVFLLELALPITFSLLASLFVALVFLPIATVVFGKGRGGEGGVARDDDVEQNRPMLRAYRALLSFTLAHRFGVAMSAIALTGALSWAGQKVEKTFERGDDGSRVRVTVDLPRRYTLREASDTFAEIERWLIANRASLGAEDVGVGFRRTGGDVTVWLPQGTPETKRREISRVLREDLPKLPGVRYRVGWDAGDTGAAVNVMLSGPDSVTLAKLGDEVVDELAKIPELTDVHTELETSFDELQVVLDRDQIQRYSVTQESLQGLIAWGVGGQPLRAYAGGTREIPMQIEFEEDEANELAQLRSLQVPIGGGATIALDSIANFKVSPSFGSIRRKNGVTSFSVQASSLDKNSYRVNRIVAEAMERVPMPLGYSWSDQGRRRDFERNESEVLVALGIGIAFVFLLMGMLFESWMLPLAVLLAIPPAFNGAFLGLLIWGIPMDNTAMLALILLAGVVVNNGIVLVDRIRQLQLIGIDRLTAILRGCSERLRPVLMTALTTMFGLIPMAFPDLFGSASQGSLNYQSLAVATLGGMVLSTLLTLFLVPLFYTLLDDAGALVTRMFHGTPVDAVRADAPSVAPSP